MSASDFALSFLDNLFIGVFITLATILAFVAYFINSTGNEDDESSEDLNN